MATCWRSRSQEPRRRGNDNRGLMSACVAFWASRGPLADARICGDALKLALQDYCREKLAPFKYPRWLESLGSAFGVCVQPVSATPLVVYRLAFGSPRSFADVD